ncbi:MAG: response regulator [Desulfobacterales bacterium]|uniref:histidine kinase n=1 Tax=Candidatus Desulfatibia profunda TaxID=2841695 RepID=A0A8J6NTG7_9BACT|nr:response regulator [Candidatus Desulfatibia profunda]MBL7178596.1 response regulator [Desulfobacterales bacterium]
MMEKKINALELENKLLRDQIQGIQGRFEEKIAELSMVREIGQALFHISSFKKTCQHILDVIIHNTRAQNCSIMLFDHKKRRLFLVCASDPEKRAYVLKPEKVFSKQGVRYLFNLGQGAAGQALLEKRSVLIQNAKESEYFLSRDNSKVTIGSLISIPLMIGGKRFGVINLSHRENNVFEKNDIYLFNVISNFVAIMVYSTLQYEKLRDSEQKYRILAESSNDGIAIIQAGMHVYANPKYEEITGYGFEELTKIAFEALLDNTTDYTDFRTIQSLLEDGASGRHLEVRLRGKNRIMRDVEINFSSIHHSGEKAVILSVRDLTERKALEKQLIHSQKMEAIGTLAGGVAHDLNNILSGLVSYPELLLMDIPENSPLKGPILTIKKSGEKAAAIVQDLLNLARRGVVVNEVVNLNNVVLEYLTSPEHDKMKYYHCGVQVETDLDTSLFNVQGSPVHLSKMVMNLVSNAAEAMPSGGKIILATENRYLDRSLIKNEAAPPGDYVVFSVSDPGTGISSADMERIFEPFYTKKAMGKSGTGLGMTVVWSTVKDHKGFIEIQSTYGKGTTFTLYIPATRKKPDSDKRQISIKDYMGNGKSVLVVDDVEEQRNLTCNILEKLGYAVKAVSSGEEAVDYMKKHSADLLILDMIMDPGIDGLETYKRILEFHSGQKAIIVSGFSETDRAKEALSLGAGCYLRKPFSIEKIGLAVRAELDR